MIKFIIPGRLDGLNEYTKACRGNKYAGSTMKHKNEDVVMWALSGQKPVQCPVYIKFTWYEQNERRDIDNIAFAKKFILDALVKKGVLQGDNQKYVCGFSDRFEVDKQHPRIEIEIIEMEG